MVVPLVASMKQAGDDSESVREGGRGKARNISQVSYNLATIR